MQSSNALVAKLDPDRKHYDHWKEIFGGELVPLLQYEEPVSRVDMERLSPEVLQKLIADLAPRNMWSVETLQADSQECGYLPFWSENLLPVEPGDTGRSAPSTEGELV